MAAPPRLNRNHPLAQGLLFLTAQGYPVDLVTGLRGTFIGSMNQGRSRWGPAFESRATTGNGLWFSTTFLKPKITTRHSILLVQDLDSIASDGRFMNWPQSGYPHWLLIDVAGGTDIDAARMQYKHTTDISQFDYGFGAVPGAGRMPRLWTRDAAANIAYAGGVQVDSDLALSANPMESSSNDYFIMFNNEKASLNQGADGRLYMVAIWNRPLTPGQALIVSKTPDVLLERPFVIGSYDLTKLGTAGGQASNGVARATVAVTATAVEKRQTSGVVSARVAVVASSAASRQAAGAARAAAAGVSRQAGSRAAAGAASARAAAISTQAGTRAASGAISARAAVVATTAESRATTGASTAVAVGIVRTAGASVGVVGGAVRATVAVSASSAGSRATSGAVKAAAAVHSRQAASRATSGAARAACVVYARPSAVGSLSLQGAARATVAVSASAAGRRATAGFCRAHATTTTQQAGRRAAAGQARAVGVVYARLVASHLQPTVFGQIATFELLTMDDIALALEDTDSMEMTLTP